MPTFVRSQFGQCPKHEPAWSGGFWSKITLLLGKVLHGGLWYFILYCIVWYIKLWDGIVSIVWQGIVCWEHIIARYCTIERPHNVVLYNYSLARYCMVERPQLWTWLWNLWSLLVSSSSVHCALLISSHCTTRIYTGCFFLHWYPPKK